MVIETPEVKATVPKEKETSRKFLWCPLTVLVTQSGVKHSECMKDRCGFWCAETKECSMVSIVRGLGVLVNVISGILEKMWK